jgi:hypothetical protein
VRSPAVFLALKDHDLGAGLSLVELVRKLVKDPDGAGITERVRACIDALPDGAAIEFIGAMWSRAGALRVNVSRLTPGALPGYLRGIGWESDTSNTSNVQWLVSTLYGLVDAWVLCLDVTDRVMPRLGIECILYQQPECEPRWEALFAFLAEHAVCTDAKIRGVLDWPGYSLRDESPERWPTSLALGDRLVGSQGVSTFYRYISHMKVIYDEDGLSAKAYLGFCHKWLHAAQLGESPGEQGRGD